MFVKVIMECLTRQTQEHIINRCVVVRLTNLIQASNTETFGYCVLFYTHKLIVSSD